MLIEEQGVQPVCLGSAGSDEITWKVTTPSEAQPHELLLNERGEPQSHYDV